MGFLDAAVGAGITGLAGYFTGKETNKANQEQSRAAIAAQAANQEKGLNALTGSTPNTRTTRNSAGGFDVDYIKGSAGDLGNINDKNAASSAQQRLAGLSPTIANLSTARNLTNERDQLNFGRFESGLNKLATQQARLPGARDNNAGLQAQSIREIGDFADANRANAGIDAVNLFQGAKSNDEAIRQAIIDSGKAQSQPIAGPNTSAANVVTQTPPPSPSVDLSSALAPAAVGNFAQQFQQQQAAEKAREEKNAFYQQILSRLGNQSAQVSGGPGAILPTGQSDNPLEQFSDGIA